MSKHKYWRCRECDQFYDIDVNKCIACGSDEWMVISEEEYIYGMECKLLRLKQISWKGLKPRKRKAQGE